MPSSEPSTRTLVLATRNDGKIKEIQEMLADTGWTILSARAFPGCPSAEETGATLEENAILKARAVAAFTGHLALADDSGLEVDALDGAPGVRSARFAGTHATDAQNNAALLARLHGIPGPERSARFRCVIAIAAPDGQVWTTQGTCKGRIATEPRGSGGFGYDPLFIPEGYDRTFAELDAETKHRISHRGRAIRSARTLLQTVIDQDLPTTGHSP